MYLHGEFHDNEQAYRRLKPTIDTTYGKGRFVALANGEIVADAATFEELNTTLNAGGRASGCVFVIQAGEDYPEFFEFPGVRLCPVPKSQIVLTTQQVEQIRSHHAFRRLKPIIDQSYPQGHFVAIDGGEIVADADSFEKIDAKLDAMGKTSRDINVIQVGENLPEYDVLFSIKSQR